MSKAGLLTVWFCTTALAVCWMVTARFNARIEDDRLEFLATSGDSNDPQKPEMDSSPQNLPLALDHLKVRPQSDPRSIHRLRNEVTQLRQQERALRGTLEMVQTAQATQGPLVDESRRLQIEIARLEEIERNLAAQAPDESSLESASALP